MFSQYSHILDENDATDTAQIIAVEKNIKHSTTQFVDS